MTLAETVHVARLTGRDEVGGGLFRHQLAVSEARRATYQRPGQYVSVTLGSKSTFFALAGEPLASTWEILVRVGGDVADALLALPVGGSVDVTEARGPGFPLAEAVGRRLFVLATGSGIAAVRSALRARVASGHAGSTELYLGVRSAEDVPLRDEIDALRRAGVAVTVSCSRQTPSAAGFVAGYVQDALARRVAARPDDVPGAIVFAAGVGAMIDQLKVVAQRLQLDETDVRTNY